MTDKTSSSGLRIIFAGTPDFAADHLLALLDSHHRVIGVYSQPDRPAGRGKKLKASPVKALALEHDIAVYQPISLKDQDEQQQLRDLDADIMVVVAYGLLLPQTVLDTPRLGCINVHGSLLPRWRGAAPIQRAIEAGDAETGITIMQMDIGLDTGDMLLKAACTIENSDTSASLFEKLTPIGQQALLDCLDQLQAQSCEGEPQNNELANYAHKINKQEARIDWSQSAEQLNRLIRAFNPFPVAYTTLEIKGRNERLKIWQSRVNNKLHQQPAGSIISRDNSTIEVACGEGSLQLEVLQMPGKKALPCADILRGYGDYFTPGTLLGADPSE